MERVPLLPRFAIVLAVVTAASAALGETASPPADDARAQARAHAERGRTLFDLGRFEEALAEYNAAYELVPAPGVLFNMGQCQRLLGNHERAIFFFQGYLRAAPDASDRPLVEDLIAFSERELERQRAEQQSAERARAEEERRAEALLEEQRRDEELRAAEAREAAAAEAGTESGERRSPFYRTWWFWTVVGCVVAGATAAGVVVATWEPETVLPSGSLGTIDGR